MWKELGDDYDGFKIIWANIICGLMLIKKSILSLQISTVDQEFPVWGRLSHRQALFARSLKISRIFELFLHKSFGILFFCFVNL